MDGLFGKIAPAPEPGTIPLLLPLHVHWERETRGLERDVTPEAFSQRPISHIQILVVWDISSPPVKKSNLPPIQP